MAAYNLEWRTQSAQLDLFNDSRPRDLETTIDDLINRFGKGVVVRAKGLRHAGTMSDGVILDCLDSRDGVRIR